MKFTSAIVAGALFALVDAKNLNKVLRAPRATIVHVKEDELADPVVPTISTVEKEIDLTDGIPEPKIPEEQP